MGNKNLEILNFIANKLETDTCQEPRSWLWYRGLFVFHGAQRGEGDDYDYDEDQNKKNWM